MLGVFVLSGGEDNLNFRVINGTSAPASPKERDIWVNTSTAITSWDFSPTQPLRRSSNANLLVYPYASGAALTTAGITFTCNSSGHVTVSGTATAAAYYRVHNDTAGVMYLEPGTYTLSGCPAQPGSGNSYYLYLYDIDNGRTLGSDYGSGITVTLSARMHVSVSICVMNGKTASSAVFKPKLEKAAAATAYIKGDATGQVWFKTGDTGDASLNALNENGIWLNISGARQYVDGAWSEVPSKVYINGVWIELKLWDGTIYEAGAQVKSLSSTGVGTTHTTTWNASNVTLNATLNAGGSRGCGEIIYTDPLTLSDFSTLTATFSDASATVRGDAWVQLFVTTTTTPSLTGESYNYNSVADTVASAIQSIKSTASGTLTVDISALSEGTSYVVGVALIADSNNWDSDTTCTASISKLICS